MCSVTDSERPLLLWGLSLVLLLALPLSGQQPAAKQVPFRIDRGGELLKRKDSTGAQTYVLQDDVLITHDQSTISCELLTYFPDSNFFLCTDSVRVTDQERSLFCDSLFYLVDSAYYRAVGAMRWSTEQMRGSGDLGEYWRDLELFRVTGDAFAADSSRELRSNKLEYDYATETLRAEGDVRFLDNESGSEAEAAGALYNSKSKQLVLRGRPVLTYYEDTDSQRADPFRLTGDVVTSFGSDSLAASGRVRLWQDSLTVTADSLFYDRGGETSYFRGGPPLVEHPDYRLSSELLDVHSRERKLKLIEAVGSGRGEFWSERPDSSATADSSRYVSWVEGDSLSLYFSAGAMDSIYSTGSARSYYHENAQSGINYVQGGVILLVFKDNKLDVVEVGRGGSGVYLPPDSGGTMTVIPDSAGFQAKKDTLVPR